MGYLSANPSRKGDVLNEGRHGRGPLNNMFMLISCGK